MDVEQLALALRDEHPQAIALIFLQLPNELTARALAALPPEQRADVATRMATTQRVDPAVSRALLSQLKQRFGHFLPDDHPDKRPAPEPQVGGAGHLASILKHLDPSASNAIVERVAAQNPSVAARVRDGIFTFEDVASLSDRDTQRLWRELQHDVVALALRYTGTEGESGAAREKLLSNVSQRRRTALLEEIERIGPQRLSAVREAQDQVAATARRLADAGEITIARGPKEELR